ncbi:RCC1 domain-containing protein [Amycolatopsis pigmentata]|uniref:RCC1 domain-containing protein n=1 Tax=Amycolatopsis pigmentata TaxID=450801 RepID=A0ABW5FRR1_9PSEU
MRYRRWGLPAVGALTVVLVSTVVPATAAAAAPSTAAVSATPAGSSYTPVVPTRLMDTRNSGKIAARSGIGVTVGTDQVPMGATAVVLNVTGLDADAATYIDVYPADGPPTSASNLNIVPGDIRANLVTVPLAAERAEIIAAGPGGLDAVVDLEGYYSPGTGAGFTSSAPRRVLDTRDGTGGVSGKVQSGQTVSLDLSAQVPLGTTAVAFTLTAVDPTQGSYVTAWPGDAARPLASNLNIAPGQITPNVVTVGVSADRKVNLYNNSGAVDLVADLAGYYSPQSTQVFYPLDPMRALDTRDANGNPLTPIPDKGTRPLGLGGWLPPNASSAVVNLTGTNVTAAGTFVTAWPSGQTMPTASNLNLVAGQTAANFAVVATGSDEGINLYNLNGNVDAIVDLFGYFAPQLTPCASNCAFALGTNLYGRLGNGTTSALPRSPAPVFGLSGVTATTGDQAKGYALRSDGTVWAWGVNSGGELGNGTSGTAVVPGPGGGQPFDSPVPVQVNGLSDITAIALGFALRSDGTVWSWGPNYMWRLGDGNTDENGSAPTPVQVTGLTGVVAIAGNPSNGYALKSDGTVWSWGENVQGELGNGTSGTSNTCVEGQGISPNGPNCASAVPVQVSGLTGVTKIGLGLAAKSDGTVWRWGPRGSTQQQDNVPVQVPGLTNVTAFAGIGPSTYYALRSDGTVWAWGDNTWTGALGNGTTCSTNSCYTTDPVQVTGLTGVTAVSAGVVTGYALRSDGTVWAWGGGQDGALGDGQLFTSSSVPVRIAGLSGVSAIGDFGYSVVP